MPLGSCPSCRAISGLEQEAHAKPVLPCSTSTVGRPSQASGGQGSSDMSVSDHQRQGVGVGSLRVGPCGEPQSRATHCKVALERQAHRWRRPAFSPLRPESGSWGGRLWDLHTHHTQPATAACLLEDAEGICRAEGIPPCLCGEPWATLPPTPGWVVCRAPRWVWTRGRPKEWVFTR